MNCKGNAVSRILLIIFFVIGSNSAMAEWVGIGRAKDGIGKFYANPATEQRAGSKVILWVLTDFKQTQKSQGGIKPYKSYKVRWEIDCKQSQRKNLGFIVYAGSMANGEVVLANDTAFEWEAISKASILEVIGDYACKKK
jgi:hypothetical protein